MRAIHEALQDFARGAAPNLRHDVHRYDGVAALDTFARLPGAARCGVYVFVFFVVVVAVALAFVLAAETSIAAKV